MIADGIADMDDDEKHRDKSKAPHASEIKPVQPHEAGAQPKQVGDEQRGSARHPLPALALDEIHRDQREQQQRAPVKPVRQHKIQMRHGEAVPGPMVALRRRRCLSIISAALSCRVLSTKGRASGPCTCRASRSRRSATPMISSCALNRRAASLSLLAHLNQIGVAMRCHFSRSSEGMRLIGTGFFELRPGLHIRFLDRTEVNAE